MQSGQASDIIGPSLFPKIGSNRAKSAENALLECKKSKKMHYVSAFFCIFAAIK
jgi:hypothetical protein